MIFALVPYILQLVLIIHCIKTNKPFYWIYLIIFIPYVGGVAYLLVELLPALLNSRQLRQTGQSIVRTFNPSHEIKRLQEQLENQDTVSNRTALAQAYIEAQQYDKAVPLLQSCLTGPFADDRATLFLLARALFADGQGTAAQGSSGVRRNPAKAAAKASLFVDRRKTVRFAGTFLPCRKAASRRVRFAVERIEKL